jgi:tRNA pseudouridine38-40 synthase
LTAPQGSGSGETRTLALVVAYDGRRFKGWQKGNGLTVQGELEKALLESLPQASRGAVRSGSVDGQALYLVGAGRTDAGVHAEGQAASVRVPASVDPELLLRRANELLPEDVAIKSCRIEEDRFHAQYRALSKTYRYRIVDGPVGDPFLAPYAWRIPEVLDEKAMAKAAEALLGQHDFSSLTADKSKKDKVRTITELRVQREAGNIEIFCSSEGFLWNQVRIMAALLAEAGKGTQNAAGIRKIIAEKDRSKAPPPAPAKGLTLIHVRYE